jgi:RES domain-containing protein
VNVEVADLSTPQRLAEVGLDEPVPGRGSWDPFQRVGEQIRKDGWAGLITPSAARPEGTVLCLFRHGHTISGAQPIPPPRKIKEPPPPPTGLRT